MPTFDSLSADNPNIREQYDTWREQRAANGEDPILALVPAERRSTLIARAASDGTLEWNVVLQGKNETVFFDF